MEFLFKEWQEVWIPPLKERELEVKLPKARKIITFTGVRRSGKTYTMFHMIKHLAKSVPKESIFYVNFEDERIEKTTKSLTGLIPALLKLYGNSAKDYFLFLDELQVMPGWSQWLRRVHDTYRNMNLIVSGSSSKMSSVQIPTELRGRALNYEIFPLSFSEFLGFSGVELEKHFEHSERKLAVVKGALEEYMEYGGFPEVVIEDTERGKKKTVQEYFRTIISRDIAERHNVKNTGLLNDFLKLLLNTKDFSVNKTANILRSQGKTAGKGTLINYANYAEESCFCFFIPIFSYKIQDQMRYPKKVYFIDNSFITNLSMRFSADYGKLYENLVAVGLMRRKAKDPMVEIYYWRNSSGEVDFVVKEGLKVRQLIQVCYDIGYEDTKKRELKALSDASKELGCSNLLVITENYEGHGTLGGKRVVFTPLWKWLLGPME